MAHAHITKEQRYKIESLLELDYAQTDIAEKLGKDRSAISREIRSNCYPNGKYKAAHANKLSRERRKAGRRKAKKLVKDPRLRRAVINRLKQKDSPEQIAGRRKKDGEEYVAHETIYQYIYTEKPELVSLLRQKKGKYRRRHGTRKRAKQRELAKKTWITDRPESINNREEPGHWEGDTIVGQERTTGIATHVERVSGYGLAVKLGRVTAESMHEATVKGFKKIPRYKRLSETNDNGKEFSHHERTERALGMKQYFALPYHSWERGTNENWNGLLRQFFPKGSSFATVTQDDVDRAVYNLNHRPRKRLGYLTPHEVFVKGLKP